MMPDLTGQYFLALSIMTMYSVIAEFGITSVTTTEKFAKDPDAGPSTHTARAGASKLPHDRGGCGAILTGRFLGYEPEVQTLIAISSVVLVIDALQVFFMGSFLGFRRSSTRPWESSVA